MSWISAFDAPLRGLVISYSIYQMSWGVLLVVVPVAVIRALGPTANADLTVGGLWAGCGSRAGLGLSVPGGCARTDANGK